MHRRAFRLAVLLECFTLLAVANTITISFSAGPETSLNATQTIPFFVTGAGPISFRAQLSFGIPGCAPIDPNRSVSCGGDVSEIVSIVGFPFPYGDISVQDDGSWSISPELGFWNNFDGLVVQCGPFAGAAPGCGFPDGMPVGQYGVKFDIFDQAYSLGNATISPFVDTLSATIDGPVSLAAEGSETVPLTILFAASLFGWRRNSFEIVATKAYGRAPTHARRQSPI